MSPWTEAHAAPHTVSGVPLLILTSLAAGDKHGHGLMKDIERFSGVHLGPGTLYKAMARLDELGLIEALDPDARRRPYGITPGGVAALERSLDHLGQVVDEGRQRLGLINPLTARVGVRAKPIIGGTAT
jgi:DNA-binding PadR family transcriptional regulator